MLSGVFKVARRRFRVQIDPLEGFERAAVRDSGDLEVYAVEEVWALVRCVLAGRHHPPAKRRLTAAELAARSRQNLIDAAVVLAAALCGLRRSELIGLRWRAVVFEQRAIVVRRGFTHVGGDRLPKGQPVHSVPMAPQVHELLLRLRPPTRYVHYQPQLAAAELLGRRFAGAAGEIAELLADPLDAPGTER